MKEIIPGLYQAERRCPHATDIRFCPLYVAAHDGELCGLGCLGNDISGGECEVDEGASYIEMVAALRETAPGFVAKVREAYEDHERRAQIARNMEMAGLKPQGRAQ